MEHRKIKDELDSLLSFIRQRHKEFLLAKLLPLKIKTSSRGSVLYAVYEDEGMVQDDISTRLSMDKAFVTRELNALAEAGLIHRLKDPQDHRKNHIFLTEQGREIGEDILKIEEEWVKLAYAGVTQEEFSMMKKFAEHVGNNIRNAD